MSSHEENSESPRPTMRTLDDKLALVRLEQKAEHTKTRALVLILAAPSVAKAAPYVLGAFGWHLW